MLWTYGAVKYEFEYQGQIQVEKCPTPLKVALEPSLLYIFAKKKEKRASPVRNGKLGKVTDFGGSNFNIEWAVLGTPLGGCEDPSPPRIG